MPVDEAKLLEEARRGARAFEELTEVRGALAALEAEYVEAWKNTGARDTDGRDRLWQAVQIVGKVETHLRHLIDNGKIANKQVQEIRKVGEKPKIFGIV